MTTGSEGLYASNVELDGLTRSSLDTMTNREKMTGPGRSGNPRYTRRNETGQYYVRGTMPSGVPAWDTKIKNNNNFSPFSTRFTHTLRAQPRRGVKLPNEGVHGITGDIYGDGAPIRDVYNGRTRPRPDHKDGGTTTLRPMAVTNGPRFADIFPAPGYHR
jgi:hypothetical protein